MARTEQGWAARCCSAPSRLYSCQRTASLNILKAKSGVAGVGVSVGLCDWLRPLVGKFESVFLSPPPLHPGGDLGRGGGEGVGGWGGKVSVEWMMAAEMGHDTLLRG